MFVFFEGLSNIYTLSTLTVFLAVIIAFYCANFIKFTNPNVNHSNETNLGDALDEECDDDDEEEDEDDENAELSEGLVAKLKSARLKELESNLTDDQLEEEKRIEREQLAAIFELLKRQEAELNTREIDEFELTAQMALYR